MYFRVNQFKPSTKQFISAWYVEAKTAKAAVKAAQARSRASLKLFWPGLHVPGARYRWIVAKSEGSLS